MAKRPKVIPFVKPQAGAEQKPNLIAADEKGQRIVIGIGSQRIAFDFFSRITKLPPHTGDQPAAIVPMQKKPPTQEKPPRHSDKPQATIAMQIRRRRFLCAVLCDDHGCDQSGAGVKLPNAFQFELPPGRSCPLVALQEDTAAKQAAQIAGEPLIPCYPMPQPPHEADQILMD